MKKFASRLKPTCKKVKISNELEEDDTDLSCDYDSDAETSDKRRKSSTFDVKGDQKNCDTSRPSLEELGKKFPLSKVERRFKEISIMDSGMVPKAGHIFQSGKLREAGDYLLGPILGSSPVRSMIQCLGRKKGTDEFYTIKILTVKESKEECQDDKQGKMLLHTEHSLLSFLNGQPGVLREHALFEDYAFDCSLNTNEKLQVQVSNGKIVRRICLVLDCVIPHPFNPASSDYINLQHYVIGKKKLPELDALTIFYNIVLVVKSLHDLNVIHRDLKLANLVLHQRTKQITLTNFCLGQHLLSDNDKLLDQRGSPAYISPDVLSGKPYLGKPSDMWGLGVVLFTMLYGQFPFYHRHHQELFKMIKTAQYTIPNVEGVKSDTLKVIQGLLCLDPHKRLTANQVLKELASIITARRTRENIPSNDYQVVPQSCNVNREVEKKDENRRRRMRLGGRSEPFSSSDEDCCILDYSMHRTVPHPENGDEMKVPQWFENISGASNSKSALACYTTNESSDVVMKSGAGISIVRGDFRSFTEADLIAQRSLFPHYSGPELFGGWRSSSSVPPPPPPPPRGNITGRTISRVESSPNAATLRLPSSRLSLPSPHIPSSGSSSGVYEFPPARKWTLAMLQQIDNSPEWKRPTVPQLSPHSDESVAPSTSGAAPSVPDATTSKPPEASSSEASKETSVVKKFARASLNISRPVVVGNYADDGDKTGSSSSRGARRNDCTVQLTKLTSEPGCSTSTRRLDPGSARIFRVSQRSRVANFSNLAMRRIKKNNTSLQSGNNLNLQLAISDSDASSSSSSFNSVSSSSNHSSNSAVNHATNSNLSSLIPFSYHANEDIHLLPIDDNNNNEDNNNNNDDNNNSENTNFNVSNLEGNRSRSPNEIDQENEFDDGD